MKGGRVRARLRLFRRSRMAGQDDPRPSVRSKKKQRRCHCTCAGCVWMRCNLGCPDARENLPDRSSTSVRLGMAVVSLGWLYYLGMGMAVLSWNGCIVSEPFYIPVVHLCVLACLRAYATVEASCSRSQSARP
ncbi:hypothetical protein C8Q74DRAFT_1277303 [Fomes fomentarius]|nr:hypothetical protein C8Q74DRAFT_1277303 [Fomes fomentarius]